MSEETLNKIVASLVYLIAEIQTKTINMDTVTIKELREKVLKWNGYPQIYNHNK